MSDKLDDRIAFALRNGPLDSYALAEILWPHASHANTWRYQANGGPPGWVLPLGKAIKRMGLRTWHEKKNKMVALATEGK